ncbi:RadC family protein [Halobacillus sp. A5]|uniref:JAB domain-containing protein n=1 Tax=Halobacillus sp. A5 TaxID=2880263 RepID=UPI0020A6B7E0|nr:JAB domain-containing protein [Halobacillus sp. A5]MCP3029652.1 DNA repair protein RadC [Halobacillus sp. A5]
MKKIMEVQRIKQVKAEIEVKTGIVRSPEDAAELASEFIGDDDREVMFVMCLNTKNEVVAVHRAHVGSLNASIVHPREIFKSAILNNAASIIVAHQHPSNDVRPSQEDISVTRRLHESGQTLGIQLLDSLIVSSNPSIHTSLKENGYL